MDVQIGLSGEWCEIWAASFPLIFSFLRKKNNFKKRKKRKKEGRELSIIIKKKYKINY
jgi:hypothetical protein